MKQFIALFTAALALTLGGCAGHNEMETTSGFVNGEIGEEVRTMFYTFTLRDPYMTATINGSTAPEDEEYLVIEITIQNTDNVSIEMADTEFCVAWGDGENDYTAPVTYYSDTVLDENQMPESYTLRKDTSLTGLLIYEVPADQTDFTFYCRDAYIDKDGNSANGAEYDIKFTPDQR